MFENNTDFDADLILSPVKGARPPFRRPLAPPPDDPSRKRNPAPPRAPKTVVKRKFPGPAGLLPDSKNYSFLPNTSSKNGDEMLCSQMSASLFQDASWLQMIRDYEDFIQKFNIRWIKTSTSLDKLYDQRAPFLGALIQSIRSCNEENHVTAVLKDTTGEIQATIIHSLYKELSDSLQVGSVIVLKQFGVVSTSSRNHLNITHKNLVRIYSNKKNDEGKSEVEVIKLHEGSFIDIAIDSEEIVPTKVNTQEIASKLDIRPVNDVNRNIFEEDFEFPDDLDECLNERAPKPKFNFKKKEVVVSCSQISVNTNEEESGIWENAFEGVDADSLFEDF